MRLKRLDLVRYGKFTERSIDLGTATTGRPDFHLVYGPNEAGKSTLFSAFLDLLFGIETRSAYGFLHPYATMRIGGTVEIAARDHHVFRVKRNQNSLLGPDDQPLPDNLFSAALGSIDRATYQTMFSLDDDSIERGGESILKSEGELGSLLFSASSGLPDTSSALARLKGEADGFYKPQGRKHRLAELKAELDRLTKERAAIDVNAREYANLRKAHETAAEQHEAAVRMRAEVDLALATAKAKVEVIPLLARLRGLRTQLADHGDMPEPPSTWAARLPEMQREEAGLQARITQLSADIERAGSELDALPRDDLALAVVGDLDDLERSGLEARYLTAAADLPSRLDETAKIRADIAIRLGRLGLPTSRDASALILPTQVVGRLQELIQNHSLLVERMAAAKRERDLAEETQRTAAIAIRNLADTSAGVDTAALSDLVKNLRQSDCLVRQQAARREIVVAEDQLAEKMKTLSPADVDAETLATILVPDSGELADWTQRRSALQEEFKRLDERIKEEEAQLAGEQGRLDALLRAGTFVADDTVQDLRHAREDAWRRHLDALDRSSATIFEQALRADDAAGSARLSGAQDLAVSRTLSLSIGERNGRLTEWRGKRILADARLLELRAEISDAAMRCGLPQETKLDRLTDWLSRRAAALEVREKIRAARNELKIALADEERALARLAKGLAGVVALDALPATLEDALPVAERLLDGEQQAARDRKSVLETVEQARLTLETRSRTLRETETELALWTSAWDATLAPTWLKTDEGVMPPASVQPVLAVLQELQILLQKQADFDHRIDGMRKDQTAFAAAVNGIAAQLHLSDSDTLVNFRIVRERVGEARNQTALSERLKGEQKTRMADCEDLLGSLQRLDTEKAGMLDLFGCETLAEVQTHLEAAKTRNQLRERIVEVETDLAMRLSVADANAAELVLSAIDENGLRIETAELQARWDDCDRDVSELHAQRRDADRALASVGGGDAAAHLDEQRRTVLMEIEEGALAYLKLKAGILASEQALRLYRERHRSAMMQRASDAFSVISGGDYVGLSTQAEGGKEYLIANAANGGSKLADDLSKGTRFQLYLALRIAGYHEIAATRESLPFIADDIMETFDDGRAYHAFRLMAGMAGAGQVIYLTHHQHLCDIASRACPDVKIHQL